MKLRKILLVCVLSIFCFACGFPSEEQVKNDFRSANPTYAPISAIVGEGHGDAGYITLDIQSPTTTKFMNKFGYIFGRKMENSK